MQNHRFITLLSDFGDRDGYVGIMKGVMAQVNPELRVIDLTHQIPAQDVAAASFQLMSAYPYFPSRTVHVAVVDPGVGGTRRAIALQTAAGFFVGPDSGIFSGVLAQTAAIAAVELIDADYWRVPQPSATFHGRDIFAPVGAHLASGVALTQLGRSILPTSLMQHALPSYTVTPTGITGCIQAVDHFGNLITTIPAEAVAGKSWSIQVGQTLIASGKTYSENRPDEFVALIGSHGYVEVAVCGGHAQRRLQPQDGDTVQVIVQAEP